MTTAKDGSLRTQAVNPKKEWNIQGQDPLRVRDSESETRHQTRESGHSTERDKFSESPVDLACVTQRYGTSEVFC